MSSSNSACMLSHFSRIWLFATPQTVTRQVPLSMGLYCKDTGVGSHFLLQGNFPTQASNHVFCGSCIGRWILYYWASWEAHLPTETILFLSFWFRCLFFSPWLIALANMSNTKLNRSVKSGNCCPWLQRKSIQLFSPLSMTLAVNLFYMAFILSKYIPSLANVLIFLS